ncbi:MAG: hypothetical protein JOZ57_02800 [Abitibacteriaceae bacterium]|nr:hypothetical protein [Abditibacteriaceae bacterium]
METGDRDEHVLALRREAQSLRLELKEREQAAHQLQQELVRQRRGENARVQVAVQTQSERLLADTAAPAVQLLTQAHLLEQGGQPVQVKDVLVVAKRLVRALETGGLMLEGHVGESVLFDPNCHEPLNGDIQPGQTVVIRFVGASYRGKMLRKASVENL